MKFPNSEGIANQTGPESCVAHCEVRDKALTGVPAGRPLSRENRDTNGRRSPLGLVSEILRIGICRAERRNVEFGCLQDGFLGQVHEHLGILVIDSVDMAR